MYAEHEFSLDAVNVGVHSLGVFDDQIAFCIVVDEVCDVGAGSFEEFALGIALGGYEQVGYLLA